MAGRHRPILPWGAGGEGHSEQRPESSKRQGLTYGACRACAKRKSKCNGRRPVCGTCSIKGSDCVYTVEPGQTRTGALKEKNATLERNLNAAMDILSNLRNLPHEEAVDYLSRLRLGTEPLRYLFPDANNSMSPTTPSYSKSFQPADGSISSDYENLTPTEFLAYGEFQFDWFDVCDTVKVAIPKYTLLETATKAFFNAIGTMLYSSAQKRVEQLLTEIPDTPLVASIPTLAELSAISALGAQYSQMTLVSSLARLLYYTAKTLLDEIVDDYPLIAMRACSFLAIYTITSQATAALALLELGLALGQSQKVHEEQRPSSSTKRDWTESKKVYRTLLYSKNWLSIILSYQSNYGFIPNEDAVLSLVAGDDWDLDDHIQLEISKVSVIKIFVIRTFGGEELTVRCINKYRAALAKWQSELPTRMHLENLLEMPTTATFRQPIYFTHLVYLSAATLLYRRLLTHHANNPDESDPEFLEASNEVAKEGAIGAKQKIRILHLLMNDGAAFPKYWLCLFSTYTSCAILLHTALLRVLDNETLSAQSDEILLAEKGLEVLEHCGRTDWVGRLFHTTIKVYYDVLQLAAQRRGTSVVADLQGSGSRMGPAVGASPEELNNPFRPPPVGDTIIHKASRDMIKVLCNPLGSIPVLSTSNDWMARTLINVEETSWGLHLDWSCETWPSGKPGDADDSLVHQSPLELVDEETLVRLTDSVSPPV